MNNYSSFRVVASNKNYIVFNKNTRKILYNPDNLKLEPNRIGVFLAIQPVYNLKKEYRKSRKLLNKWITENHNILIKENQ